MKDNYAFLNMKLALVHNSDLSVILFKSNLVLFLNKVSVIEG